MKSIKEGTFSVKTIKGGVELSHSALMARSLVLFTETDENGVGTLYNVTAKCRNTDKKSIMKCLVKAVLSAKRVHIEENSTEAVQESKLKVASPRTLSRVLGCNVLAVTDKDGKLIEGSMIRFANATEGGKVRDVIKFNQSMPLYKLIVTQGFDWSDKCVIEALGWYLAAAVQHLEYLDKLDAAVFAAADSTEAEDDKREKLVKDATKIAEKKYAEAAKSMAKDKAISVARTVVAEMVKDEDAEFQAFAIKSAMDALKDKLAKAEEKAAQAA